MASDLRKIYVTVHLCPDCFVWKTYVDFSRLSFYGKRKIGTKTEKDFFELI